MDKTSVGNDPLHGFPSGDFGWNGDSFHFFADAR
jgi:hypothetical protein